MSKSLSKRASRARRTARAPPILWVTRCRKTKLNDHTESDCCRLELISPFGFHIIWLSGVHQFFLVEAIRLWTSWVSAGKIVDKHHGLEGWFTASPRLLELWTWFIQMSAVFQQLIRRQSLSSRRDSNPVASHWERITPMVRSPVDQRNQSSLLVFRAVFATPKSRTPFSTIERAAVKLCRVFSRLQLSSGTNPGRQ